MDKAVFFDRDGVINSDDGHYYIYQKQDFKFNPGIIEGMKLLSDAGFRLVIISNQGGISKGIYKKQDTDLVHQYMISELAKHTIFVDEIYYCPHHSDLEKCFCRKPASLMIEKAMARFSINKAQSFLIGDSKRDIEAGENVGLTCFLVNKNESILNLCRKISKMQ